MTEHELDTLLRDYGGAVRAVCRAILPGHPQDAEEAEADTFYKLWRGAHLPADETHRRRLVVRTARQCAIARYRALLRRGETLPLETLGYTLTVAEATPRAVTKVTITRTAEKTADPQPAPEQKRRFGRKKDRDGEKCACPGTKAGANGFRPPNVRAPQP